MKIAGTDILYFAYGSNMSVKRIISRIPSAAFIDTARLQGHQLGFHKVGRDGSGKCDIEHTGEAGHVVLGVLFKLLAADKQTLDRIEGLGCGYEHKQVIVHSSRGNSYTANTYYATDIDGSLSPFHWYKTHVLKGACEHQLPSDYIRMIETVSAIHDPDSDRHNTELAIYR